MLLAKLKFNNIVKFLFFYYNNTWNEIIHGEKEKKHRLFIMRIIHNDIFPVIVNNLHIEILEHGYLFADSSWKFYGVNSPFNRLYIITSGKGYIENEHQHIDLVPGNLYLIPAHTTYNYICDNQMEKFYIHFHMNLFAGQNIFDSLKCCAFKPWDNNLINDFLHRIDSQDIKDLIICKSILIKILLDFLEPCSENIKRQFEIGTKYKKIFEYIENHCNNELSINDISIYTNISISNLSKCFKRDMGFSLKKYIDMKLIEKSKELLLFSDMNVKEIAHYLKFNDEFYFSRFFKKHVGIPPSEYKKQNIMK